MKISELTLAAQVNETDAFATTQSSGGGVFASVKTTLRMLADKIVTGMNFTSDLQTTNKTISGAINEKIQSSSIAPVEVSPAESNHSVGEHIIYNGERYKVVQAIVITDSLVIGTNIVKETVEESFAAGGGGGGASWTDVTGTLTAGQTSITLSSASITTSSTLDFYTDVFGVSPTAASVSTGSVTLTFSAQQSNMSVKVRVS